MINYEKTLVVSQIKIFRKDLLDFASQNDLLRNVRIYKKIFDFDPKIYTLDPSLWIFSDQYLFP